MCGDMQESCFLISIRAHCIFSCILNRLHGVVFHCIEMSTLAIVSHCQPLCMSGKKESLLPGKSSFQEQCSVAVLSAIYVMS